MKSISQDKPAVVDIEPDHSQLLLTARQQEADGNNAAAITTYEKAAKKYPTQANIYDRLLILYRKEKLYKKELSLLNNAIKTFTTLLQPGLHSSKKVTSLSKSILMAVGLTDKKGKSLYLPQPIARWEKRKKIVLQKLKGK